MYVLFSDMVENHVGQRSNIIKTNDCTTLVQLSLPTYQVFFFFFFFFFQKNDLTFLLNWFHHFFKKINYRIGKVGQKLC
jgi:hypothetical protein